MHLREKDNVNICLLNNSIVQEPFIQNLSLYMLGSFMMENGNWCICFLLDNNFFLTCDFCQASLGWKLEFNENGSIPAF